jgi:membrane-bound lytic murein transglycosylase B
VPTAQIAPELNGVLVDSYLYRTLQTQHQQSATALSSATSLVASSSAELTDLQLDDARLTTEIEAATARKKTATITLAQARAGLRTLAIETYVNGRQEPSITVDLDVATRMLTDQTLTQAVSEQQSSKLRSSTDALAEAVQTLTSDLSARTQDRQRIAQVQSAHDQALQDEARLRADLVAEQGQLEQARVTATVVGEDFALVAVDAYWKAAQRMQTLDPACGIPWWALAGITRSESRHGTYGGAQLLANGDVNRPIIGIPLDGTNNTAVIGDTDGGAYDGDPVYDHAVGPMQFIPSTWRRWASDGNGDGRGDPNNIYDAALAAARYLCATGPMRTDDDMRRGFYSYNHSDAYVATVLNYAKGYANFQI